MMNIGVTLPDGKRIKVLAAVNETDRLQGLIDIPYLPFFGIEGMLFRWPDMALRGITMKGCLIPLDVVWLDPARKVLHVAARSPGAPAYAHEGQYVLEIAMGKAHAHCVEVGAMLRF